MYDTLGGPSLNDVGCSPGQKLWVIIRHWMPFIAQVSLESSSGDF